MKLEDVAKLAGVSTATVSLVINQAEGSRVSQKTKTRVLEAIRKLDYNPNISAKRLASGKTNCIGLYVPYEPPIFRNYANIEMVTGIQDVLNERGFDLVLFSGSRNLYKDRPINQIVRQNAVDGLIIFNTRDTSKQYVDNYIKNLNDLKFNFVVINYYWGKAKINYVGLDYENDVFKGVSHLISLGHKEIALIAGTSKATVTPKMIKGYKRALSDNNIDINNDLIIYAGYDYQIAYEKTQTIIHSIPSLTSFFIGGVEMAPACLKAVKAAGLSVPKDISILCYIDDDIMPLLEPPLTSYKWPFRDMGKKAAELLVEGHLEKKRVLFETELMMRDSTSAKQ
jgi:DNA-binding LacI/PurR family transcriptional regulator